MSADEDKLHIQLVNVPDEMHMLTPGEVRQVALDYSLFHGILQSGSTLFGCVNVNDWSFSTTEPPRGSLLSILQVKNLVQGENSGGPESVGKQPVPKVMVECRCSGRFDVHAITDGEQALPEVWKLMQGECTVVHDWSCWEIADRKALAELEWTVWELICEVASLMRKLRIPERRSIMVEQELSVWAPAKYDRDILEEEWAQTPIETRAVWCQRAESFSFGVLRCLESDADTMFRARGITNTLTRLELAMDCLVKKKAKTSAQLSIKNALN